MGDLGKIYNYSTVSLLWETLAQVFQSGWNSFGWINLFASSSLPIIYIGIVSDHQPQVFHTEYRTLTNFCFGSWKTNQTPGQTSLKTATKYIQHLTNRASCIMATLWYHVTSPKCWFISFLILPFTGSVLWLDNLTNVQKATCTNHCI